MPKVFLNPQTSQTHLNALVSFCNDNQQQSAQLGYDGDSSESRPEAQLKSTARSTDDSNDSDDSRKRRKCTDDRQTDVGRRETKIQTTNGVTECSIQPRSSESHVRRLSSDENAY